MITRAQIRRQLRSQGGIMNAVPRQGYFLGGIGRSIGKAVRSVTDPVKEIVKSPVGKAALLGAGIYGLGGGFGGFKLGNLPGAGFFGKGSWNPLLRKVGGDFAQSRLGSLISGIGLNRKTAIGAGALTLLGLSQEDQPNPEELMSARRSGNIEEYLRRYYSNVNPGASDEEVDEFVRVNKASGGRIGFNTGTKKRKEKKSKGAHVKTVREILEEEYPTLFSDTTTSIEGSPGKKKYYKGKKDGGRIGYALGSLDPEDFPPKPIDDPLPFDLEQETGIPFSGQQVKELDAGADSIKKEGTHIAFYNTGNDRQNAWNVWDSKELSEQLEFDGFEDFFINGDWRDLIKGAAPVQGDMQMASSPDGELFMMEEFLQAVEEGFKGSYQDYLDQIDRIPSDYWGQAPSAEGIMQAAKGGRVKYGLGDLVGIRRKALSALYEKDEDEEYVSGGRIGYAYGTNGDEDDPLHEGEPLIIPDDADISPDDFWGKGKDDRKLMAGPDWWWKRVETLEFLGYDSEQAQNIAADDDKYFSIVGDDHRPGGAQGGRIGYATGKKVKKGKTVKEEWKETLKFLKEMDILLDSPFTEDDTAIDVDVEDVKYKKHGGRIRKYGGGILAATGLPGIPRMAPDGLEYDMRTGGFQPLGAREGKDDVNAKLAKNEFVMTADAVRGAGGGDINKGAQRMYDTMKKLEGKIA